MFALWLVVEGDMDVARLAVVCLAPLTPLAELAALAALAGLADLVNTGCPRICPIFATNGF